jgi:hypothetical protein
MEINVRMLCFLLRKSTHKEKQDQHSGRWSPGTFKDVSRWDSKELHIVGRQQCVLWTCGSQVFMGAGITYAQNDKEG